MTNPATLAHLAGLLAAYEKAGPAWLSAYSRQVSMDLTDAAVSALPALLADSAALAEAVALLRRAHRSVHFIAASRPDMIAGSVDDYSDIAAFLVRFPEPTP